MRVLVTGASGTIGSAVLRALRRRRHEVFALVTSAERGKEAERTGASVVVGDLLDPDTARRLVPTVEGVVHAAQIRLDAGPSSSDREAAVHAADWCMTKALADACLAVQPPLPLVYTSGVWCFGDHGERWIDEDTPADPPVAARGHHVVTERLLELHREKGLPATILLPGVVYGPVASFENWFYQPLVHGEFQLVGDGANFWSVVHADDLGDAYAQALEQPRVGERFSIVDDEPIRAREFFELLAVCASCPPPKSVSPSSARAAMGSPLVESLTLSTRVDNRKAKRDLGWRPRYPSVREGMPRVIEELAS